ncbi:MAG: hypothetical protein WA705_24090 [Candidatus Ozemobacteraceae bacterium]
MAGKTVKSAEFFLTGLNVISNEFQSLGAPDIQTFRNWYVSNNDIQQLCAKDPAVVPILYKQIETQFPSLSKNLKAFFENLYSEKFLGLEIISSKIGWIKDHYRQFVSINKHGRCPYCGIFPIDGVYDSTREAYDHYLPKSKYPFNSINFKNLAPMCEKCNSKNKSSGDPLHDSNGMRRKAFYSYQTNQYQIEFEIRVQPGNWNQLKPDDLEIFSGPPTLKEEIDTWFDVFNLEDRYKALLCKEAEGKAWIEQVLDEWTCDGKTPDQFMTTLSRQTFNQPLVECRFLKKPFLEACQRAGLFRGRASPSPSP